MIRPDCLAAVVGATLYGLLYSAFLLAASWLAFRRRGLTL